MTPVAPTPALARLRATYPAPSEVRVLLHRGTCGDEAGAEAVRPALLAALGATPLIEAVCDGACWAAPAATVVRLGHRRRFAHLDSDPDAIATLTACVGGTCDDEYAGSGEVGVTARLGRTDGSLAGALAQGAYAGLAFALTLSPQAVAEAARAAGAVARGGPMARLEPSWREVPAPGAGADAPLLVFYAARDEAGRYLERHLIEGDPHRVIEGALIAAHATGVHAVALSAEGARALEALRRATDEARVAGIIAGSAFGAATAEVYLTEAEPGEDDGPLARRFEAAAAATVIFDAPPPPTAVLAITGSVPRPGVYEVPIDGATQWAGVLAMAGASPARVPALRLGGAGGIAPRIVRRDEFDRAVRWDDIEGGSVVALDREADDDAAGSQA